MAITFSIPTTEFIMTTGQTEALCQDMLNAARDFEDDFIMMGNDHILDAEGKAPLGLGVFTEIVLALRDPWTVRFEDEATEFVAIRGGTILAFDSIGDPRPVSTNPGLTINQAASGILIETGVSGLTAQESQAILDLQSDSAANTAAIALIQTSIANIESDVATIQTDIGAIELTQANMVKIMRNKKIVNETTGILTIYEDNGVDVWWSANIYESDDTSIPYRGQGLQLQERLEP